MAFWTDEQVARLAAMIREGVSAGMIAAEIGTTRNAVIGKARRKFGKQHWDSKTMAVPFSLPDAVREPVKQRRDKGYPGHVRVKPATKLPRKEPGQVTFRKQREPELSKSQLRAMLAQAWANTAALSAA